MNEEDINKKVKWLPIETAPKDRDILVYNGQMYVAWFTGKGWYVDDGGGACWLSTPPTDWQEINPPNKQNEI